MSANNAEHGTAGRAGEVVVGVDGSRSSKEALAWAAEEARLRGATLRLVHAWHVPATAYMAYAVPLDAAALEKAASELLEEVARDVLGEQPDVPTVHEVVEGPPVEVIVEASKAAALVVVGSRGLGGFSGLLLGSVSSQVAHRAHCPVTIWREHS
jgi:nucleotide-binding universal stress UspA family protein